MQSQVLVYNNYKTTEQSTYLHRAGPWHRRNRQMLGAPLIHRGTKMSKDLLILNLKKKLYYQFYLNTINLTCYTKSDRPTKTTILLLSPVRRTIFPSTQPHFHIYQLPDCKRCSLINYGGGGGIRKEKRDQDVM